MTTILELKNVAKTFGGVNANRNVSLAVRQGTIAGLIGPNGSGKTTLFNSISGAHPVDGGSIQFLGKELTRLKTAAIARLGLVRTFQQARVFTQMTCVENMQVSASHARDHLASMFFKTHIEVTEKAEGLLDFVGLYAKRRLRAGELSFGQQKLLEFAMALMNQAKMLLLDEPLAGINPTLIGELVDRLKRASSHFGLTLFVIEHNMPAIMDLADHIYCLAHGELLAGGSPDDIRNDQRVIAAYLGGH